MLTILLGAALSLSTPGQADAEPFDLSLSYRDLALDTPEGRAQLARRVEISADIFCRRYWQAGDPWLYWSDDEAWINPQLANHRYCAATAAFLLVRRMPAALRRAYVAGRLRR